MIQIVQGRATTPAILANCPRPEETCHFGDLDYCFMMFLLRILVSIVEIWKGPRAKECEAMCSQQACNRKSSRYAIFSKYLSQSSAYFIGCSISESSQRSSDKVVRVCQMMSTLIGGEFFSWGYLHA